MAFTYGHIKYLSINIQPRYQLNKSYAVTRASEGRHYGLYFFLFKMVSRIATARGILLFASPARHNHHRLSVQIWRNYTSRNILKLEERGLWADYFPETKYAMYMFCLCIVCNINHYKVLKSYCHVYAVALREIYNQDSLIVP